MSYHDYEGVMLVLCTPLQKSKVCYRRVATFFFNFIYIKESRRHVVYIKM